MNHFIGKMKISIIEDNEILREWLIAELENDPMIEVVSQDRFGRQGIVSAQKNCHILY